MQPVTDLPTVSIAPSDIPSLVNPSPEDLITRAEAEAAADLDSWTFRAFDPGQLPPRVWRRLVSARARFLAMLAAGQPLAELASRDYQHALDAVVELICFRDDEAAKPPAPRKNRAH